MRILPEAVPEKRIASFSHMSMTYRPDNPMYGESGAERLCWNGQSKAESKACEEGAEIWYSGERHQPGDGRNCAKLTFNPWYDEQLAGHSRRDGPMKAPHTSACKFFELRASAAQALAVRADILTQPAGRPSIHRDT